MKDKNGVKTFEIYWDQVWHELEKNKHYKKLKSEYALENGKLNISAIEACSEPDILKHYELLQLDALDKIYLPYMNKNFRWTNDEKRFVLQRMKEKGKDLFPNEVKQLLSEYNEMIYMKKNRHAAKQTLAK